MLLFDNIPIQLQFHHIKAHQDEFISAEKITLEALCNIDMDYKAKVLTTQLITTDTTPPPLCNHPHSLPTCHWKNVPIQQCLTTELYSHIMKDKMIQYWIDKNRIESHNVPLIDFDAMAGGAKLLTTTLQRFPSKWSCEYVPTGKNMKRWNMRYDGYCPFCRQPQEDTKHIMECLHIDSTTIWKEALQTFLTALYKLDTCWYLTMAVKRELIAWRYSVAPPNLQLYPYNLRRVIMEQRRIGWKLF